MTPPWCVQHGLWQGQPSKKAKRTYCVLRTVEKQDFYDTAMVVSARKTVWLKQLKYWHHSAGNTAPVSCIRDHLTDFLGAHLGNDTLQSSKIFERLISMKCEVNFLTTMSPVCPHAFFVRIGGANAVSVVYSETSDHLNLCKVNGKHSDLIRQPLKWFIKDMQVIFGSINS